MSTDPLSKAPDVSVIVPHFNQVSLLEKCLLSLGRQTMAPSRFEVIVADNASPCDLAGVKRKFPATRFVSESKRGAAHARNAAIALAKGDALAFIDADCIAHEAWLEEGLKALETSDLAGGEVLVTVMDALAPTGVEAFERIFAFQQRRYINRKNFSVTANLFATRTAVEAIGPFRNGVAEDVDWCRRAGALGFRLAFNRTSIISHPARRTFDELTCKWDRLITERWNGFRARSFTRRIGWAGLAVITALSAAPHLMNVIMSRRVGRMEDKVRAAGVLTRIRFWRAQRMLMMLSLPGGGVLRVE